MYKTKRRKANNTLYVIRWYSIFADVGKGEAVGLQKSPFIWSWMSSMGPSVYKKHFKNSLFAFSCLSHLYRELIWIVLFTVLINLNFY